MGSNITGLPSRDAPWRVTWRHHGVRQRPASKNNTGPLGGLVITSLPTSVRYTDKAMLSCAEVFANRGNITTNKYPVHFVRCWCTVAKCLNELSWLPQTTATFSYMRSRSTHRKGDLPQRQTMDLYENFWLLWHHCLHKLSPGPFLLS